MAVDERAPSNPNRPPNEKELLAAILEQEKLSNQHLTQLVEIGHVTNDKLDLVNNKLNLSNEELSVVNDNLVIITNKLDTIIAGQKPPDVGGHFNWHAMGTIPWPQEGGSMPLEVTCSETEAYRIQVKPTTTSGKPSKIQSGSLKVVADQPTGPGIGLTQVKIENDDTFLVAANLDGSAAAGSTSFTVSGDSDLGAGVVTLTDQVLLNVTTEMASNLGVTAVGAVPRDQVGMPKQ